MPKTGTRNTADAKISGKHSKRSKLKIKRYITIDALRGFAVLMMIFVSALYLLAYNTPLFLLHNQGDVFLFFDLVAPTFQFVLGMSLFFFILHRQSHGFSRKEIMFQVLWKYMFLIMLGFALDIFTYLDFTSWGVLETLGVAGIVTYFVSGRTNNEKMLISALIVSVYSLLYYNPIFANLITLPHGGPVGAASYSVISIIGFMAAEALYKRKSDKTFFNSMLKNALVWIALGILLSLLIPFNKTHASPSFILASAGIVMIFYLLFFVLYKTGGKTFDALRTFGRSALTMWVIQYMFGWIFLFIIQKKQFLDFIPGLLAALLITLFMYFVSVVLDKRNIRISF